MDCTYVLQLFIRESSLEYYSESVCQPQCMCSMALKNPPIFKWKNLRNVNSTLCFDFNILIVSPLLREYRNATLKYSKKNCFFLYGAFRYYREKNMSQSAMTLIAERHTPRFFKLNQIKILKSYPGALYSAVEKMAE